MKPFKLLFILIFTILIVIGCIKLIPSIVSYIEPPSNNDNVKVERKANKISNAEVSGINHTQAKVDKKLTPSETISSKAELSQLIARNILSGEDTVVTIKDSSLREDINNIAPRLY